MKIGNLDTNQKVILIAELSANHGNNIEIAKKTILSMKESGADVVKLQSYTADTITLNENNEYFQISNGTIWDGQTLYDLYKKASMPLEWTSELFEYAREIGIEVFSSPFDFTTVDLLESLNAPAYKIASFEITDIPLIKYAAKKQKPMIISTGIASIEDIQLAIDTCYEVGNKEIMLLKTTSQYPAKVSDANIKTMIDLKNRFNVEIGLSDHTKGSIVPVVAAVSGAKLIEKHFILNHDIESPDSSFSMTPDQFKKMATEVRLAESAIGKVTYELTEKKRNSLKFSRSLFITKDIDKGEIFTEQNIRSVRPGDGLHPKYYSNVIGKKAASKLTKGYPLEKDNIEGGI